MRAAQPSPVADTRVRLRVLSYNIHGLRADRAALVGVVRQIAPDVAILQEAPRRLRWRYKCAAFANDVGTVIAAGGLPSLGNLLLTTHRVRVTDTWCVRYPLTPGRHLRGAAFARCAVGPARFVVAGSHLATDATERPEQARALGQALAGIDQPVILGLDLNETPPMDAAAPETAWAVIAAGRTDTAVAAGRAERCTYPCVDPRRRIDALLVDKLIDVLHYDVVDSALARRASDHLPVVADLLLPAGG